MSTGKQPAHVIRPSRQSVLQLSHSEARRFFLKSESYCNIDLPPYLVFSGLLSLVDNLLSGKTISDFGNGQDRLEDVNYTILNNKDGRYAWRPLQLIHPALYVSLVHRITEKDNWRLILARFSEFSANSKITCLSLPVRSLTQKRDKAEQILHWWQEVEQKSIELSLDYAYLLETDISDCYGSLYTHTIAWALHSKDTAKKERNNSSLVGNTIDQHIRWMQNGQTNGIPQGSVLMDFVAEMVLGYADTDLSKRIESSRINDYQILRYRDDYRIFVNNPQDGERILKLLTETTIGLNLKLNSQKTKSSAEVVRASIKIDKYAWMGRKHRDENLRKHLLIIHDHAIQFPNAGSLDGPLRDYHKRLAKLKKLAEPPLPLIGIVVDIAYRNPRTYSVCAAILSQLLRFVGEGYRESVVERIKRRFSQIPNTGHMQIWLQRITLPFAENLPYEEPICRLVCDRAVQIWNNSWISAAALKRAVNSKNIVSGRRIKALPESVSSKEVDLFTSRSVYYG